ncbi:hypothetical protein LTR66_014712 [Elasticomyces elasticus]|nr:hypothetical protein LTR66_014712 [Elasticomyces elasticus]
MTFRPILAGPAAEVPQKSNGLKDHDGSAYMTSLGNTTASTAIVLISPTTFETTGIINSVYGLPRNDPDDVAFVVSRTIVDMENKYLFVTDVPDHFIFGQPYTLTSLDSPGIYYFDLGDDDGCTPVSRRLLDIARQGFADDIKLDDFGRIYTAEYEGIAVRNGGGRMLDLFNTDRIFETSNVTGVATVANFAPAGDKLFILGFDRVYQVQVAQVVKSWPQNSSTPDSLQGAKTRISRHEYVARRTRYIREVTRDRYATQPQSS